MLTNNFDVPGKIGDLTIYNVTPIRGGDAYLFVFDDVTFLYDSGFGFSSGVLLDNIKKVLGDRPLDYVLLTHSHYDHALGSSFISKSYADVKVVACAYANKIMTKESARNKMLEMDYKAARAKGFDIHYDSIEYLHADIMPEDGDTLMLGSHEVKVVFLPGHTKDSIAYYFPENKMMLGCETAGLYVNDEVVMPSFLVGYQMTLDSINKVNEFDIEHYLIPHMGMVDGEQVKIFLEQSYKYHEYGKDLIVNSFKAGRTHEEIIKDFADVYYTKQAEEVYPPSAFLENINIQIPLVLREFGLIE